MAAFGNSKTLHIAIVCLFLLTTHGRVGAQGIRDTLFEEVKARLEPLIDHLPQVHPDRQEDYNLYIVDAVLNLKDEHLEPLNRDRLYDLKIKQLEQDWGLNLRAQINHNFDNYFFNQDEFDFQQTPMRLRVGLDWDLMKDGLLSNQNKIQRLKNQKEADWLRLDGRKNHERLFFRSNVLIYFFNKEKIKLLRHRQSYLEQQLELLYRIYYIRDILFEEIIAMKGELEQIKVQLKNYLDYNSLMESVIGVDEFASEIDVNRLPLLDLDMNRLLNDSAFVLGNKAWLLDQLNDQLENAAVNDISLRVQLYQNVGFTDPKTPDRTYTSAGIVASVPLELMYRGSLPDQIAGEKAALRTRQAQYTALNTATEIVNYYYEFNYKLKQYVQFLYKYMLYEERLRVEQVDREHFTDYYQPFRILKNYDQLVQIKLELLDLKQQLYQAIVRIYAKTNIKSLREYLLPVGAPTYYAKLPATRTIFM
ncbi:MAG TPA: hypothetical protein ENJ20_03110, partial [Bacteroidetes bacterium]|nr:hypothetical protein [Bacteroidota bacterium]